MVIAGVVGEGLFESLASKAEGKLRTHDEQILADAGTQIGAANDLANGAATAASAAKSTAETVSAEATSLEKDIVAAKVRAARAEAGQQQLRVDLAKQQEKTALAEKEVVKLQALTQWRTLTAKQEEELVTFTADVFRKGPVDLTAIDNDAESVMYAEKLAEALKKAGWAPTLGSITPIGGTPIGLILRVKSKATVLSASPLYHAARLDNALSRIGVGHLVVEWPSLPDGTLSILVGHRPPPEQ